MIYFERPGRENTQAAVKAVLTAAQANDIRKIVVPSCTGRTALLFKNCGREVTVVTHQAGFKESDKPKFPQKLRQELRAAGMNVLTTTHFLAGADRALNYKFGGIYPSEIIAHTLRILGQGFKVCVEIAVMAMDAGYIDSDEDIIALGGTAQGVDTAVLLRPAHSQFFFDIDIKEIICMPRGHRCDKEENKTKGKQNN